MIDINTLRRLALDGDLAAMQAIVIRLERVEKERDVLRDRLALETQEHGALRDAVERACEERDALRTKIEAMERQELGFRERCAPSAPTGYSNRFPLYALPGAKSSSDGRFADMKPCTGKCRKCGAEQLSFRVRESSCGGYEDYEYGCRACGYAWWVDGIDS